MNKKMVQYSLFTLSTLFVLSACSPKPVSQPAEVEKPVPVQVTSVSKQPIRNVAGLSGSLKPNKEININSQISGKVKTLYVQMGQKVSKGDTLFVIDDTDIRFSVKQAEAAYAMALANLKQSTGNVETGIKQSQNGLKQSENAIEQAKNAVTQAEQNLQEAIKSEERTKALYEQGATSLQDYERVQNNLKNANIAYQNASIAYQNSLGNKENASISLETARQKLPIDIAKASANQSLVSLENAKRQLGYTVVKAPISGVVASISVEESEMVSPQVPALTLVNVDSFIVSAQLSEREVISAKAGDIVDIEIPLLNKKFEGEIKSISPIMNEQLKSYPIEITLNNKGTELKANMVAYIALRTNKKGQEIPLVIPQKAVFEVEGKKYVYKVKENHVEKVEIEIGYENSDWVEIKKGLQTNEKVVVRGHTLLKDGKQITIQ